MADLRAASLYPKDLGLGRLVGIFALLSIALLVALAFAPARSHYTEWRAAQQRYNALARRAGSAPVEVAVKQIWKPELGVVDRCGSCHLADGGAAPIAGEGLFADHPPIPHDPRAFGCTVCHAGQGRATSVETAHGHVRHWDEPLLGHAWVEAGCGTCHSNLPIPPARLVERGRAVVAERGCLECHGANRSGSARAGGPDLSYVGLKGIPDDWASLHAARRAAGTAGWERYHALAADEAAPVDAWLRTLVGAPRLVAGKALSQRLGCLGCHRVGGVGGPEGPDLSNEGRKAPGDLVVAGAARPPALPDWLAGHFVHPARVVAGSEMPPLAALDPAAGSAQADLLTVYMLSLRTRPIPEALAPPDRVRGMRLGERDFPSDGESLYAVFCSACHGARGEGRRWGKLTVGLPAIGNATFLGIADDEFLRRTITDGRPGRRMPAWGPLEGGLRPKEISAVVGFLRSLQPAAPPWSKVAGATPDLSQGQKLYAGDCAYCHGKAGEGSALGPPLTAADRPLARDEAVQYRVVTAGVSGTAMPAYRGYDVAQLRSLVAAVAALPPGPQRRTGWTARSGDPHRGEKTFTTLCSPCHGRRGEGGAGPGLALPGFQSVASDGYIAATIALGRPGTAMQSFRYQLAAADVANVVAFIRSLAPPPASGTSP